MTTETRYYRTREEAEAACARFLKLYPVIAYGSTARVRDGVDLMDPEKGIPVPGYAAETSYFTCD